MTKLYEQERSERDWVGEFLEILERTSQFLAELARFLLALGWMIKQVVQLVKLVASVERTWREEYI